MDRAVDPLRLIYTDVASVHAGDGCNGLRKVDQSPY